MSAKPLRIAVISHDGTLLGYVQRKPTNGNWRNLGRPPRVSVTRKVGALECDRVWVTGTGWLWTVRVAEGETPPADMEAP